METRGRGIINDRDWSARSARESRLVLLLLLNMARGLFSTLGRELNVMTRRKEIQRERKKNALDPSLVLVARANDRRQVAICATPVHHGMITGSSGGLVAL